MVHGAVLPIGLSGSGVPKTTDCGEHPVPDRLTVETVADKQSFCANRLLVESIQNARVSKVMKITLLNFGTCILIILLTQLTKITKNLNLNNSFTLN